LLQEAADLPNRNAREAGTVIAPLILSFGLEHANLNLLPIEAPYFRHSQGRKNRETVDDRAAHLHFKEDVGRRLLSEINPDFAAHARLVGDPVTLIRLNPTLDFLVAKGCLATDE